MKQNKTKKTPRQKLDFFLHWYGKDIKKLAQGDVTSNMSQ